MSKDKKNTLIVCSKCNAENITDNRFCYNCGNSLFNGNDSSNDVENNSNISVQDENVFKKNPDFSVLGLFAALIPLLIFFNVFGII